MPSTRRTKFTVLVADEIIEAIPRRSMNRILDFVNKAFSQAPFDTVTLEQDVLRKGCRIYGTASAEITKAAVTVLYAVAKDEVTEAIMMIDIYKDRRVTNASELKVRE